MKMAQGDRSSLWDWVSAGHRADRFLRGAQASASLAELVRGSSLGGRRNELRGRSVLLATKDQLPVGLALIELDGIARRIVLCPPDLPADHIPSIMATGAVDAVVSDSAAHAPDLPDVGCFVICN